MENLVKYNLFLNGRYYGTGDLKYINELITDHMSRMEFFNTNEVEFKIEKFNNTKRKPPKDNRPKGIVLTENLSLKTDRD